MSARTTILVVGAAEGRVSTVAEQLSHPDYRVVKTASIDEALSLCVAQRPRLVIFDETPPDVRSFCDAVKAIDPAIFGLQILGAADASDDPAIDPCVDAVLVAPVDTRALFALVRSLLRLQKVEADLRESEERLELAQEAAGLAILDWQLATNSLAHSAVFAELFDLPDRKDGESMPPEMLLERIHPEDLEPLLTEFVVEGQIARSFDKEFRIRLRDGRLRWISARGRFFVGPSGLPERMLALSFDISQRKEAERVNAQLASIVASSIDAIVSVDLDNTITTWNAGAERLFGFTRDETIGQPLDKMLVPEGASDGLERRRKLALGEASAFETIQKTKEGATIDISVNGAPMHTQTGAVMGASLIMRDNAPQRRREDHVRFLMRELTHRSKNLLAVIQAMARQSLSKEITPEEFVKRFSNRLSGLAGSHDLLSAVDWKGASLVDLIRSQLRHYEDLFGTRIVLDGDDIIIRPAAAQNIGIALHELSTNAAKYGALSVSDGSVTIAWRPEPGPTGDRFMMTWREQAGPEVVPPTRKGFGHIVMDRIAGQALNGRSNTLFPPEGVVWSLDVPLQSVADG